MIVAFAFCVISHNHRLSFFISVVEEFMAKSLLVFLFVFMSSTASASLFPFSAKRLLSDSKLQLNDSKNSVYIFMSSGCPCSRGFTEYMNKLVRENDKKFNFYIVVSNANEDWKKSKQYFSKFGFSIPIIKDDRAKVADHFGAMKTPHVFVTNSKEEIVYSGGVTDRRMIENAKTHYLKEVLISLNKNEKPRWSKTRALGCYIPRS